MKTIVNKYTVSLLLALAHVVVAFSQSIDQNYIQTWDLKVAGYKTSSSISGTTPVNHAVRTIQYFDGLGRLSQTMVPNYMPDGMAMVTPKVYNEVGLDIRNYQPYVHKITNLDFRTDFENELSNFYIENFDGDPNGKAPVEYEKSPLQRILKQGAPGAPWQIDANGHYITFEYLTNTNTNELKAINWKAVGDQCVYKGLYPAAELYVLKTTAEDGAITYEFKDKLGNVVLKRSKASENKYADTYYVYDDFNLLRFVISPEGSAQITGSFYFTHDLARKYVYYYKYDSRKRLIEKKLPGKESEYTVYNKMDMPIMYQDGNMRKMNGSAKAYEWQYTKYDALGRVIITGITNEYPSQTRDQVQALADANENCWEYLLHPLQYPQSYSNYYSGNTFPYVVPYSIQTLNYYDTYTVIVKTGSTYTPRPITNDAELSFNPADANFALPQPDDQYLKGLPTVSFVNAQGNLYPSVTYYDKRGRVIQTRQKGHISGTYTITSNNYYKSAPENITNMAYASTIKHKYIANGISQSITEKYTFTYDNFGRLTSRDYQAGDVMALHKIENTYTPLGQLQQKKISEGNTLLQTVDYGYNIRGWLTSINNPANVSNPGDLFGMNLYYNLTVPGLNNQALYSGNISATEWQTVQASGTTTPNTSGRKAYRYSYDPLSRLTDAYYSEFITNAWQQTSNFDEKIKSYDLNGNIKGIERRGSQSNWSIALIDNLKYHYFGNQLIAVDDDEVLTDNGYDFYDNGHFFNGAYREYEYDANGNITRDVNKGIIGLTYNHLNLPKEIYFGKDDKLDYLYDANGNKLRQDVIVAKILTKRTDFISNFVIINNAPAWINFDEGRVIMDGTNVYFTETHLRDHLGNTRVVFGYKNNALLVKQVNSYYPFGMNIKGLTTYTFGVDRKHPTNEYLYNGKMFQDELGLDWLDYGARFYDAVLGRWHVIDPLAEKYPTITPNAYAGNNPIVFIDPNGQEINVTFKGEGAEELYKKIINNILNKQFEVTLTGVKGKENTFKVGLKSTKEGGDISKLSKGAQSFYTSFNEVVESKTVVNLDVFNGSNKVVVGNYKDNAIDVGDMNQFAEFNNNSNEQAGATKQGKMIHETREQFWKAIKGQGMGSMNYVNTGHEIAVGFENSVNGNTRLPDLMPGRNQGIVEQFQRTNGTVVKLLIIGGQNSPSKPIIVVKPYQ
jgi:RHS repeat-associated protein